MCGKPYWLLIAMIAPLALSVSAGEAPADGDEYEPPPEGYEERHYQVRSLLEQAPDFPDEEAKVTEMAAPIRLTQEDLEAIIKYSVAPDTWTRRGAARLSFEACEMVVLQKKEVHAEIAKVLEWLAAGALPQARTTIIVAALKPDTLKKFTAQGTVAAADVFKALEEAGDAASAEIIEVRGQEGQSVQAFGNGQQSYIRDYDVSGAVYDPVISRLHSGLSASAVAYRGPDGNSARVDLRLKYRRDIKMEAAQISLEGLDVTPVTPPPPEPKKEEKPAPAAPVVALGRLKGALKMDLPNYLTGELATTAVAPRGLFVLAGTLDLSLAGQGKTGERLSVLVRTTIGSEGVPTLQGLSGLKEGESFRLYPLLGFSTRIADWPGPDLQIIAGVSSGAGGMTGSFVAAPKVAPALADISVAVSRLAKNFSEKVRRNKIVEARGPCIFTRLNNDDHAKLLQKLTSDYQRMLGPVRLRALAVVVSPAAYRRIAADSGEARGLAAVEQLAAEQGAQLMADTSLELAPEQRAYTLGGRSTAYVAGYEISGDSYDPVVRDLLSPSCVFDAKARRAADEKSTDVELRFTMLPFPPDMERTSLESFTVNSGASVNVLANIRADLDRPKVGVTRVRANVSVPVGKFVLAAAVKMPPGPDGKADARQVLVFLGAD